MLKFLSSILLILSTLQFCSPTLNYNTNKNKLNVITFDALNSLNDSTPRNTVVFIHTDWCRFCKNMELTTFENGEVINILNNNFYFVSLNAETQDEIYFDDVLFEYKPQGKNSGINELAYALGAINGELNFPTLVIINLDNEIIFQHNSYLSSKEIIAILKKINP